MATATSNLGFIAQVLEQLTHACDLDRPGPNGGNTLADELFDVDVRGVRRRSVEGQHGPDNELWEPNAPRYAASPQKAGKPIGILTGEMLSENQLAGNRTIDARGASMEFGFTQDVRQKAAWFEGGTRRQPPRPFYDTGSEDDREKEDIVTEAIERVVDDINRSL